MQLLNWLRENYQWVFDGIGVVVLVGLLAWLGRLRTRRRRTMSPQQEPEPTPHPFSAPPGPPGPPESLSPRDTKPSPFRIIRDVMSSPPLQQAARAQAYVGIRVTWSLVLVHASDEGNRFSLSLGDASGAFLSVWCHVKPEDYPELRIAKSGTPIRVTGEIQKVDSVNITLKDYPKLIVGPLT